MPITPPFDNNLNKWLNVFWMPLNHLSINRLNDYIIHNNPKQVLIFNILINIMLRNFPLIYIWLSNRLNHMFRNFLLIYLGLSNRLNHMLRNLPVDNLVPLPSAVLVFIVGLWLFNLYFIRLRRILERPYNFRNVKMLKNLIVQVHCELWLFEELFCTNWNLSHAKIFYFFKFKISYGA